MQITVVINDAMYRLSQDDSEAIRRVPKTHRLQLIELLEAVKREHQASEVLVQKAAATVNVSGTATTTTTTTTGSSSAIDDLIESKPERLGEGDIDDLMTRLVMEEKQSQGSNLTQKTIYKWAFGIIAAIAVITFLF